MKKQIVSVLIIVFVLTVLFAGCNGGSGDIGEIADSEAVEVPISEDEPAYDDEGTYPDEYDETDNYVDIDESLAPTNAYTQIFEDSSGYKIEVTMNVGSWIKGSETDKIEGAWIAAGGNGSMPLTAGEYTPKYGGPINFISSSAAYAFGNISIRNATPEYPAENFGNGHCLLRLIVNGADSAYRILHTTQYGNGEIKTYFAEDMDAMFVAADMNSNNWGPAPFVIAVSNVFTPKTPDGDSELGDYEFFVGGGREPLEFQIEKSW